MKVRGVQHGCKRNLIPHPHGHLRTGAVTTTEVNISPSPTWEVKERLQLI